MPDISAKFAGLSLSSPIIVGSAGITETLDRIRKCQENGAGAVVMKSYFEEEVSRKSPTPRFKVIRHNLGDDSTFTLFSYEQASEWDIRRYAEEVKAAKRELTVKIIPSINCLTEPGWVEAAKAVADAGADAIELNTSCPHGSITFRGGAVEETIYNTVDCVRRAVDLPLIAKISPMLTSPISVAKRLEDIGADAVTIFNRMTGLDIDIEAQSPALHGGYGGHGGPWAIMYPLRWISQIRPQLKIDIAGSGGVTSWEDVVKYLLAGANAVQVVSAVVMEGYGVLRDLVNGLRKYMEGHGYTRLDDFRGKAVEKIVGTHDVYREKHSRAQITPGLRAPCTFACPADVPAMGYVKLTAARQFGEALDALRRANPFQSVCGRACYHPCEDNCTRGKLDQPIAIRAIKRFLIEWGYENAPLSRYVPAKLPSTGKRVAVVGAGPAGLTAAYDLTLAGHEVVVFEAADRPGGVMVWGIPQYRLPRTVLQEEIDFISQTGVDIRTGKALGGDFSIETLKADGFEAVLLAIGAGESVALGIPGENLAGVLGGLEFLRRVNSGERPELGDRVAVIGGGNAAVDAARAALRLGASEVFVVYRRTRDEMPAHADELADAEAEGVKLMYLTAPVEIRGSDSVQSVLFRTGYLGEPAANGRRRPQQMAETEFSLRIDAVIVAAGQAVDMRAVSEIAGSATAVLVSEDNLSTQIDGVFAAGDVTGGAGTLISAIAQGKQAARSVDAFLTTETVPETTKLDRRVVDERKALARSFERPQEGRIPVARKGPHERLNFDEYERAYTEEEAVREAERCLSCGCGVGCGQCERVCIYSAVSRDGSYFTVDPEKCDGCGLCAERCPNACIEMVPIK